ncbi:conserved hypothetical protein, partial [Ixodes scapularis]
ITTVLTLSTFVLDTRTDLPKVPYPTSLDWFVIMCFSFVIFTLLEYAGVHYFTKRWPQWDCESVVSESPVPARYLEYVPSRSHQELHHRARRRRKHYHCCAQFLYCMVGNERFRNEMRLRADRGAIVNSVSQIDRVSRVLFPFCFILINLFYWFSFGRDRPEGWGVQENA